MRGKKIVNSSVRLLRSLRRHLRPVIDLARPLGHAYVRLSRHLAFAPVLPLDIDFYHYPESTALMPQRGGKAAVNRVILMIGDGLGPGLIHLAALAAKNPEARLHMERLPVMGSVRTHSHGNLGTDSGAAATALATGYKTTLGRMGVLPDGRPAKNIMEAARERGWRTGIVVSGDLCDATPAAFVAHYPNRAHKDDIALRILDNPPDILYGCAKKHWLAPMRRDGRDLVAAFGEKGYTYARNFKTTKGDRILGLFPRGHRTLSLPAMTENALKQLSREGDPGFFLMVEGSLIDKKAHRDDYAGIIQETLWFDLAVEKAMRFAAAHPDTLLIVTADHASGGNLLWDNPVGGATIDWAGKGHSAMPVPLYAYGPGAERFAGTMDNTDIARRIADAAALPMRFDG